MGWKDPRDWCFQGCFPTCPHWNYQKTSTGWFLWSKNLHISWWVSNQSVQTWLKRNKIKGHFPTIWGKNRGFQSIFQFSLWPIHGRTSRSELHMWSDRRAWWPLSAVAQFFSVQPVMLAHGKKMEIQPTKMVGIIGTYRVHHPGDRGIVIDESKRGAARWMSASQATFLPMIHLMEFRFRQGFNMVLEIAFSGKFHWEMLFKENIDHNFLGTSNS